MVIEIILFTKRTAYTLKQMLNSFFPRILH